jgi:hypothetical protein
VVVSSRNAFYNSSKGLITIHVWRFNRKHTSGQAQSTMASSQASAVTTAQDRGRPRTRQRVTKAPPPLEVPDIDQDAAERKRVLNVLAQRRYREFFKCLRSTGVTLTWFKFGRGKEAPGSPQGEIKEARLHTRGRSAGAEHGLLWQCGARGGR